MRFIRNIAAIIGLSVVLAACGGPARTTVTRTEIGPDGQLRQRTFVQQPNLEANPLFSSTGDPEPILHAALAGTTSVSYTGAHGTQVSYYAPDGRIYLWYPGNTVVLKGEWKALKPSKLCFKYGANTYNPYANQPGGQWVCRPLQLLLFGQGASEDRKGDVFGLAKRATPPFVSQKGQQQFREITAKLPPATADDKPSRKLNAMRVLNARNIEESDRRIWARVGQPPAVPEEAPNSAPEAPKTED